MGPVSLVKLIDSNVAECEIRTIKDGKVYSFQVLFVRAQDGNWGIQRF